MKVRYTGWKGRQRTRVDRPAIRLKLNEGGELMYHEVAYRTDFINDAGEALRRLQHGEEIWLRQYGPLVTAVQKAIRGAA